MGHSRGWRERKGHEKNPSLPKATQTSNLKKLIPWHLLTPVCLNAATLLLKLWILYKFSFPQIRFAY